MLNSIVYQARYGHDISDNVYPDDIHFSENLHVFYNSATQILHVKWQGEVSTKDFREGYTHIMRMVRVYKPTRWVLDLQEREGIHREDQRWVFKNIFPQILRLLQRDVFIAVILPVSLYESLVHDMDGDDLIVNDNLLIMNHCLYYEECLRWLNEVEKTNHKV